MLDIVIGALIMLAVCSLVFVVGLKATQHRSPRLGSLVAVCTLMVTVAYIVFLWDHAVLTRLMPFSNVIILGNWFPVGAAILSGVACGQLRQHRKRQAVTAAGMLVVGAIGLFWPMLGSPPECGGEWDGDNCLQTSQRSCMAAASATLLRHYRVEATEREMARLCFTRKGTTWLGLYHGMAVKLKSKNMHPVLFECSLNELLEHDDPQIISVGVSEELAEEYPQYNTDWGWIPGVKHAVVLLGATGDRCHIADPSVGLEDWSREDLRLLWDGRGLRVAKPADYSRSSSPVADSR